MAAIYPASISQSTIPNDRNAESLAPAAEPVQAPLESSVLLSVIIPAYNESLLLPSTLSALRKAAANLEIGSSRVELIVVDDGSTDETPNLALRLADKVINGERKGIGHARNVGAQDANGSVFVFVDADTIVEPKVLTEIYNSWTSGIRAGAVAPIYDSTHWCIKALFRLWRWYAARKGMTQGVCQFFDRRLFEELGGYRTNLFMAEDTDLYERACVRLRSQRQESRLRVIDDVKVYPSMRRYEQWTPWRILFWTNPWTTKVLRHSRHFWRHWYDDPPR